MVKKKGIPAHSLNAAGRKETAERDLPKAGTGAFTTNKKRGGGIAKKRLER